MTKRTFSKAIWKLAVLLLAVMLVAVGCGGGGGSSSSGGGSSGSGGSSSGGGSGGGSSSGGSGGGSSSGGSGGGSAQPQGTLKLGVILSFTGSFAPLAEDIRNGLDLFLEEHDYTIAGRKVEVQYEDDEADPQTALRKYHQLKDSYKADIFVGPIPSNVLYALRDQVDADKELLIVANAAGDRASWDLKSDYVHRVFMSNWQSGAAGGEWLANNLGKRAYIVYVNYAAGQEAIGAFRDSFTEAGGEIVGEAAPDLGTNDFGAYLTKIPQANPDFVYAVLPGTDAIRFLQQYQEFGLKDKFPLAAWHEFGNSLVTDPAGDASLDVYSVLNYSTKLQHDLNKKFVESYQKKYNELPSVFSVEGYDVGTIIKTAVEQAGSVETEDLVKVIKGMTYESPRGVIKMDDRTNNPIQDFYIGKNVKENGMIMQEVLHVIPQVTMPPEPPKR
mgnify:CR=1 FL=1